jgi:hypothetical protein
MPVSGNTAKTSAAKKLSTSEIAVCLIVIHFVWRKGNKIA